MKAKELQELRNEIAVKMTKMVEVAGKEERRLTDEERQTFDKMDAEVKDYDVRIDEAKKVERFANVPAELIEREADQRARHEVETDTPAGPTQRDIGDAMRTWLLAPMGSESPEQMHRASKVGFDCNVKQVNLSFPKSPIYRGKPKNRFERAVRYGEEVETRAAQTITTTAGGYLVPDEMMATLEIALLEYGGVREEATVHRTDTGANWPIPYTDDTSQVGEIIDINTTANQQEVAFGQLVLAAFKYSSKFVTVPYELLHDSNTNVPALLGQLLGIRLGRIQNTHFTTGAGTTLPWGIVTRAVDSGVTTASNTALTYSELLTLKHSVGRAYRRNAKWMGSDTVHRFMKEMSDSQGRPIWMPGLTTGEPDLFDRNPFVINDDVASGSGATGLIYGDLSAYQIRDVSGEGMTLIRLDERYAELAQVAFLAWMRSDADMLNAGTNPVKYLKLAT